MTACAARCRQLWKSSLAEAATLARRASPRCTDCTHRRSAAEDAGAFGPNVCIRRKEELGVQVSVVANVVRGSSEIGLRRRFWSCRRSRRARPAFWRVARLWAGL